jgi:UDP-N-acetylmuramate dehydrogenase
MVKLAEVTTLAVGGEAKEFFTATDAHSAIDLIKSADQSGEPILILGGGSNLLVADSGFEGRVIKIESTGISFEEDQCSGGFITVAAGEDWDQFVEWSIKNNFSGLETLSGIPGTVGASPIQNIGAYGREISESIARIRVYDRKSNEMKTLTQDQCEFSYRSSIFKKNIDRYFIVEVIFQLKKGEQSLPILYQELAEHLNISLGDRRDLENVRQAVLAIRKRKGMVLDPLDPDTRSAGSFFINPIIDLSALPKGAPSWPVGSEGSSKIKTSAAWLIENAGIKKGFSLGGAAISSKHVLAITNRSIDADRSIDAEGATAEEIYQLAQVCIKAVEEKFAIRLESEVRLLGF